MKSSVFIFAIIAFLTILDGAVNLYSSNGDVVKTNFAELHMLVGAIMAAAATIMMNQYRIMKKLDIKDE